MFRFPLLFHLDMVVITNIYLCIYFSMSKSFDKYRGLDIFLFP